MMDDEKADVLREAIDAYLGEVDAEGLDSDDLSWTLVAVLRRAEEERAPQP
ncbi:hypothetical protein ACFCYC_15270 [Streptomyces sp. NPDC056402]|uniref:hypothetical protein n=1 Tax=Streptomyces sp. NPDC056402 TaxID=3345810 RepID=UPI0035E0F993